MEKLRLAKYLAKCGIAARRKCEDLIVDGQVAVDGKVILKPEHHVDGSETITVNGKKIPPPEEKLYFILNKPKGYHCSPIPKEGAKMVLDLFEKEKKRLFTVGRLDRDTTGLLIVTNDGTFANKVIHPSANIRKEYVVKTVQEVTDIHLKIISKGTVVEETFVRPIKVEKIRKGTLKVVVKEGKKREVRRMVEAADLEILSLKRSRIGGLHLGDLPLGSYRTLSASEREQIFGK